MPREVILPNAEALARVRTLSERELTREELEALAAIPISAEERRETLALVEWFTRRYPTPAERLAYVKRAHARWKRAGTARP